MSQPLQKLASLGRADVFEHFDGAQRTHVLRRLFEDCNDLTETLVRFRRGLASQDSLEEWLRGRACLLQLSGRLLPHREAIAVQLLSPALHLSLIDRTNRVERMAKE